MKNTDLGLLISRISLGILMLMHGIAKLQNGVDGIGNMLESKGIPSFVAYGVYVGEIIAPLMMIFGVRTRIAAIFYIITMFVAVFAANADKIGSIEKTGAWGIEVQALYIFGALALFFTGGGRYALSKNNRWD